jgi:hypothetical protein
MSVNSQPIDLADAHSRMVRDLFLTIERRLNRKHADSPEYDIQQYVSDFYQDWFRNTNLAVERERSGKTDIVIFDNGKERLLYEIKTYFKKNKKISFPPLLKDIEKLSGRLKAMSGDLKAYILIAGRNNKLVDSNIPDFVSRHVRDDRAYCDIEQLSGVRLRPSRKQLHDDISFVMSWEIIVDR